MARADAYTVLRRTSTTPWRVISASGQPGGGAQRPFFADHGVVDDTGYHYSIRGEGPGGPGASSGATLALPLAAIHPAPRAMIAGVSDACITLAWEVVPGAYEYCVGLADGAFAPYGELLCTVGEDPFDNRATVCGLAAGQAYALVVRTWSPVEGYGGLSAPVGATPAAERLGLVDSPGLTPDGPGVVRLAWPRLPDAVAYRILRRGDTTPWAPVGQTVEPGFVDVGLDSGASYQYALQPLSPAGLGAMGPPARTVAE